MYDAYYETWKLPVYVSLTSAFILEELKSLLTECMHDVHLVCGINTNWFC
jgi:hypothetical protein